MSKDSEIIVYTDGSCLSNPGRGGWAAVILLDNEQIQLSGGFRKTTNNRMEYYAVLKALEYLQNAKSTVVIHTDSELLFNTMTKWIFNWKKKGWRKSSGEAVQNIDLVKQIDALASKIKVRWVKVPAHTGIEYNELCDVLAKREAESAKEIDFAYEKPIDGDIFSEKAATVNITKKTAKTTSDKYLFNNLFDESTLICNDKYSISLEKNNGKLELIINNGDSKITEFTIANVPEFLSIIKKKYDE